MSDATSRAALTGALLNRTAARRRVDLCLGVGDARGDRVDGTDHRPGALVVPLFHQKGAASAHEFDPLGRRQRLVGSTDSSAGRQRVRVWFRLDPERRRKMKQAAALLGKTCQAFLQSGVSAVVAECKSTPDSAAMSPAMIANDISGRTSTGHRHKVAIWVDRAQRDEIRAAASRFGLSVQALLTAALDRHLDRTARETEERALGWLLISTADTHARAMSAQLGECLIPPQSAAPVGAEIIPFPAERAGATLGRA
jgi:hypothetical protein